VISYQLDSNIVFLVPRSDYRVNPGIANKCVAFRISGRGGGRAEGLPGAARRAARTVSQGAGPGDSFL